MDGDIGIEPVSAIDDCQSQRRVFLADMDLSLT